MIDNHNILHGVGQGTANVILRGRPEVTAQVIVSNVEVSVTRLVSKLVTQKAWGTAPPSTADTSGQFVTTVALSHILTEEQHFGFIHAVIDWDDNTRMPLSTHSPGVNELNVTSLRPTNLELRAPGEQHSSGVSNPSSTEWRAEVPFMAMYDVGEILWTDWKLCGEVVPGATAISWAEVKLPNPVSMSATFSSPRLTAPDDAASLSPINVQTTATMVVTVTYEDENGVQTQRQFQTDPRTEYRMVNPSCGSMNGADVTVASGAVGDSSTCGGMLIVETSIPLFEQSGFGTFRVNASAPLVHLQTFDVRFAGYPQYSPSTIGTIHENVGLGVVQLGLVECLDTGSKVFHHATANAIAWLSENAPGQREYDVTSATTFTSDSAGIATIGSSIGSGMMESCASGLRGQRDDSGRIWLTTRRL